MIDYTLRRQPDGTVNAEPGDAVEYYDSNGYLGEHWVPVTFFSRQSKDKDNDRVTVRSNRDDITYEVDISRVRHARGGAGWHRLREARLRAVVEAIAAAWPIVGYNIPEGWLSLETNYRLGFEDGLEKSSRAAIAALADLDNVEPEA